MILLVSQTFVPDPAAVGQYMADVAIELARRGHAVRVRTQDRGYEDPSLRFARHEDLQGVDVRRFRFASFGKRSIVLRLLGTASFMLQSFFAVLLTPKVEGVLFSTSPPMIGLAVCLAAMIRRVPTAYWAMDLNPDQLIALGKLKPTDFAARLIERVNRFILRRSSLVITLDRFMGDALRRRNVPDGKLLILPPWPHEAHLEAAAGDNPFKLAHRLDGKFVVMYSGNHSPSNPLDTILHAAEQMRDEPGMVFLFVGGGNDKPRIEQFVRDRKLSNIITLPYQPLETIKHSLRAADVHVVSLGDAMVGVVHPCKVYGAMAVGKPVLYLGPATSHIADLMTDHDIGWQITHGDVAAAVAMLRAISATSSEELAAKGHRGKTLLDERFGQSRLIGVLCERLETTFGGTR